MNKTENGALGVSLKNKCLNLFSHIGGSIACAASDVKSWFTDAYDEDPEVATSILLYNRGARDGQGLKVWFKEFMLTMNPQFIANNIDLLIDNGCVKDIFHWLKNAKGPVEVTLVLRAISHRIYKANELPNGALIKKWCPRSGPVFKLIRDEIGWTNKQLRKHLASSETVETLMSAGRWKDIDFNHIPGGALKKYRKAWERHISEEYSEWKESKTSKANVSATYPHQIASIIYDDPGLAIKMWECLPDYLTSEEKPIIISDTSGSMSGEPMDISVALGIYCSERMIGPFKDKVITFSDDPEFHDLSCYTNVIDKWLYLFDNDNWGMSTNFEKTYTLILESAIMWNVKQEDMPTMIICISDMQFNHAQDRYSYDEEEGEDTNLLHHEIMKRKFERAGYKFPKLVYWNVRASYTLAAPTDDVSENTALISGFNPSVLKPVLKGESFNPMKIMYDAIKDIQEKLDKGPLPYG
tara:strand:+ start:479 stop:1885 length:1407 start_codon:yes stop_codon:yes gene_type:complete